jgi:hypothetical protein
MTRLVDGLNHLVEEAAAGDTRSSIMPSNISHVSESLSLWDEESWTQLRRDLENCGLSPTILADQRKFIFKWVKNAIEAGRLPLEDQTLESEVIVDESAASNSASQNVSASENKHSERVKPDPKHSSFIRR